MVLGWVGVVVLALVLIFAIAHRDDNSTSGTACSNDISSPLPACN